MNHQESLNTLLVDIFNNILIIEENYLRHNGIEELTMTEIHVIEAIYNEPSKTMTNVAKALMVTPGTLTTSVNKLAKKGYVTKKTAATDKRVHLIQLTAKAIPVIERHKQFHDLMVNNILDNTPVEHREILINAVSSVSDFFKNLL